MNRHEHSYKDIANCKSDSGPSGRTPHFFFGYRQKENVLPDGPDLCEGTISRR